MKGDGVQIDKDKENWKKNSETLKLHKDVRNSKH
jgi:hypothetical protein